MSPRRAAQDASSGGRVGLTAVLLVVAAVGMLLLVRAKPSPAPFDPRSESGSGTRGLVVLLEQQGASVDVVSSVPAVTGGARVLVLQDRLNDGQRRALLAFADGGGVVVVADPGSSLAGDLGGRSPISGAVPASQGNPLTPQINVPLDACNVAPLLHLRGLFVRSGLRYRGAAASSCFGDDEGAFVVVHPRRAGAIVQLGDNELFTNSLLRYADNGPLATALLAPAHGARVAILVGAEPVKPDASTDIGGGSDKTLADLVRPGVWMAIAQLAIAFVVFAIARAIRPGRPVREPAQVPIAGSELVVATGNLMQRARHAQRAGWLLRGNLYRALCRRFHLPATASIVEVDAAVAAGTSLPAGHVAAVLQREVQDNDGLVRLANSLQEVRDVALVGVQGEGADT